MKRTTIAAGLILLTMTMARASITPISENEFINLFFKTDVLIGGFEWENDWTNGYALGQRPERNLIQTDYFANKPTNTATISWDLPDIYPGGPNGGLLETFFRVRAVAFYGLGGQQFFEVTGHDKFRGSVTGVLGGPISQLYLQGTVRAPDSGATLPLLGMALAGLAWFNRKRS